MEIIRSQRIQTFSEGSDGIKALTCGTIRKNGAYRVRNFMDLATKVAELQFRNRDFIMMFRGQHGDYRNRSGQTSLESSLMRATDSTKDATESTIGRRFRTLVAAERALVAVKTRSASFSAQRLEAAPRDPFRRAKKAVRGTAFEDVP